MRRATLVVAACGIVLAGAGTAQAATVSLAESAGDNAPKGGTPASAGVSVVAPAGEANRLTFATDGGSGLVVRDAGAPLTAGAGCAATAPGEVTCRGSAAPVTALSVDAGDGDDVVDASNLAVALRVDGGDGNDVIRGGSGPDQIRPGRGDDDVDGGAGLDHVFYDERTAPVTIALDGSSPSGEAGEHDALRGIEAATGGAGDDTITGTGGPDVLDGGPGADRITGAGGDDALHGGAGPDELAGGDGADALDGGAGADRLAGDAGDDVLTGDTGADAFDGGPGADRLQLDGDARTSAGETAACGAGADVASAPDGGEAIAPDCERVALGVRDVDLEPLDVLLPLRRTRGGGVAIRLACDALDGGDGCRRIGVRAGALRGTLARLAPGGPARTLRLHGHVTPRATVRVTVRATQVEGGEGLPVAGGFVTPLR